MCGHIHDSYECLFSIKVLLGFCGNLEAVLNVCLKIFSPQRTFQTMSPLEKVFFLKNMCLADTSVRGKKWQMALFQVDSTIQNSFHGKKRKKNRP